MPDLYIDLSALERTRSDLTHVASLLREPVGHMAERASAVTEIDALRSRLREFGDEWDYGIGKLSKYSGSVADALAEIKRTFAELDQQLAAALEGEG
ncbi:hypothetical protein GCM10022215_17750 [Nocardioides fonticola]|uniref:WXG100 family type VII secretion target n=1 Tax=Nocardioides fonticola TaxID=450363 RepID=A0ABP7XHT9_9ACTN